MKTRHSAWTSTPVSATPFCLRPSSPLAAKPCRELPAGRAAPGRAGSASRKTSGTGGKGKEGGAGFPEILWGFIFSDLRGLFLTAALSFPTPLSPRRERLVSLRFLLSPLSSLSVPVDSDDPSRVPRDTRFALLWRFQNYRRGAMFSGGEGVGRDTYIPVGGITPFLCRTAFRDTGQRAESAPQRRGRPNPRFRWRRRRRAAQISVAPRRGAPAPRSGGDRLHTHPCPTPSSHPGSGPPELNGAASPGSAGGTGKGRLPSSQGHCSRQGKGPAGKSLQQGQRARGTRRSPAPATEPGASREPEHLEQRRSPGPLVGCTVFGEREGASTRLSPWYFLFLF